MLSSKKYTPYTYLIGWSNLNLYYYGSRTATKYKALYKCGCHPDDLFKTYYTSSSIVMSIYLEHGMPDIIHIRKTFKDRQSCIEWERTVLRRLNVINKPYFINRDHTQVLEKAIHLCMDTVVIFNKTTNTCIKWPKNKEIPTGFTKGMRPFNEDRIKKLHSRKWWKNILTGELRHTPHCPNDSTWINTRGLVSNSKNLTGKYIWITDDLITIQIKSSDIIPDGFRRGRKLKTKPSGKRNNKWIWITNGKTNIQIIETEVIPDGYWRGMTRYFN